MVDPLRLLAKIYAGRGQFQLAEEALEAIIQVKINKNSLVSNKKRLTS